jgi:hypothetical protein
MQQARLLYLPINNVPSANFIVTGKVFEYIAVIRPILCIGPKESELKEILKGNYCTFNDKSAIKAQILSVAKNTLVDNPLDIDNFHPKKPHQTTRSIARKIDGYYPK